MQNSAKTNFHKKKCEDTLQLIAAMVDSSANSFLPPSENACNENNLSTALQQNRKSGSSSSLSCEARKHELIKSNYPNDQEQKKNTTTAKPIGGSVITASKLIQGYEQNVLDPLRLSNALKEQQKRRNTTR